MHYSMIDTVKSMTFDRHKYQLVITIGRDQLVDGNSTSRRGDRLNDDIAKNEKHFAIA